LSLNRPDHSQEKSGKIPEKSPRAALLAARFLLTKGKKQVILMADQQFQTKTQYATTAA